MRCTVECVQAQKSNTMIAQGLLLLKRLSAQAGKRKNRVSTMGARKEINELSAEVYSEEAV